MTEAEHQRCERIFAGLFGFYTGDKVLVDELIQITRVLLQRPDITGDKVMYLGQLLFALERLPLQTPGICVDLKLFHSFPEGRSYVELYLSDTEFGLGSGVILRDAVDVKEEYCNWAIEANVGSSRESHKDELTMLHNWLKKANYWALNRAIALEIESYGNGDKIPWEEKVVGDPWRHLDLARTQWITDDPEEE